MTKSVEIMPGDAKENTVAQLYTLRAGLSEVSQCADEIKSRERSIGTANATVTKMQGEINENNRTIAQKRAEVEKKQKSIADIQLNREKDVREKAERKTSQTFSTHYACFWCIVAGVGLMLLAILITSLIGFESVFILYVIGGGLIVVPLIIIFVGRFIRLKEYTKNIQSENAYIDRTTTGIKEEINTLQTEIAALEKEVAEQQAKKEKTQESVAMNNDMIQKEIEGLAQYGAEYSKIMEDTFDQLLNPADWCNVDLCIFYLQTGRADSIKECLLLVDRQRQSDEIVGAIRAASDRICGEIRSGFRALGSTMVTCINALSAQIDTMNDSFLAQHGEMVRALRSIDEHNEEILSAAKLNASLQEKANVSSERLLSDYKYVQNKSGIAI